MTLLKKLLSCIGRNLPKWTERVVVYVEPAAEKAWQLSVSALQYIHKVSEPLRVWLSENVPVFVEWVSVPCRLRKRCDASIVGYLVNPGVIF